MNTFKRYEKKYIITKTQKEELEKLISSRMVKDKFSSDGGYLIRNIYYDTLSEDLVHQSIQKPIFKEKLRLRKYGTYGDLKDEYFLEIKRKYNGVVYKRRVTLNKSDLQNFLRNKVIPNDIDNVDRQILNEISYFMEKYIILPNTFISYKRIAYFDKENPEFRLTFDYDLFSRKDNYNFDFPFYEKRLIDADSYIMEVKVSDSMPLWFTKILSELKIYGYSFSKYGKSFELDTLKETILGLDSFKNR